MKRKNNLYENILSFENAKYMYKVIKKNCKNKKEVYNFGLNLNENILEILNKLENESYKFGKYKIFLIKEPKYRLIMSENISDKIVNHLVANYILLPVIENSLIDSNVAARKGKGSGYAFKLFLKYINSLRKDDKEIYILKIDISKYFYNINHEVCFNLVRKKIKDKRALKIVSDILNTTNYDYVNIDINKCIDNEIKKINRLNISNREKELRINSVKSVPIYKTGLGLAIGNMTSQILAIYYLNEVDHYIKEELKFKYYIRYMDDFIIIDTDKNRLKEAFGKITDKLKEVKLGVNKKSNIYKLSNGISFLGYTFILNNKLIIKYNNNTIRRIAKRLIKYKKYDYEKYIKSKASYKGFLSRCNTRLYERVMDI